MTLFSGQLGQYTTPGGQQITVPSGLAQAFPGLQPFAPPPIVAPPPLAPPPTAPVLPPQPAPPDASATPVTKPSQVEPAGPGAQRGPVTTPAQETDAGPPNTPAPMTNDKLAKIGTAGAYNEQIKAEQAQRAATQRQGEALANQATAVGDEMARADAHAQQLLEERARAAEENRAALQAKTEEYQRNAKAVADTKIDRSVDHPVLAALSSALLGIGQAMAGQPIDAMGAVYKAIDRKVAAQMQDLDKRRGDLALQRDALGMQREAGRDRLAEMDTLRLGYIEQAKRQIETIKQQTTSDVVRANSDLALANLDQKSAETLGSAVSREQQRREAEAARKQHMLMHQQSLGVQIRGQNLQQREADLNRAERAQEKLDAIATQIALANSKDAEKKAKEVKEQGIFDPKTAEPLLTPEGEKKMADADKAEALARKATDSAQAAKLNDHAALLRQSARLNDVVTARDAKDREKVQAGLETTQNLTMLADRAQKKLEAGPDAWDREDWASLKADLFTAKARYVATLGERVSVKALEAFDSVLSIDPDDAWWSRSVDKGKAIAALKSIKQDAAINGDIVLKGAGIKSQWRPGIDESEVKFGGKTAAEVGADARPGGFRGDIEEQLGRAGARTNMDEAQEAALARTNAKGQVNSYGLDPADNEKLRALVDQAGAAGHARYNDIASTLAAPLTSDRPGLATAVARLVRDSDPKLYADVLSKLDPARAKELDAQISVATEMTKRSGMDLSDEERSQLIEQRRERTTEEERKKYREAYDKRAAKGARGQ